jgi:hypothetical protein
LEAHNLRTMLQEFREASGNSHATEEAAGRNIVTGLPT